MHSTHGHFWHSRFWWKWVAANAIAELIGLGAASAVGFLAFSRVGEPDSVGTALAFASVFVLLGGLEGANVGAMLAWVIGMLPSTLMKLGHAADASPAVEPSLATVLLLAGGIAGAVHGRVLLWLLSHQQARR